VHEHGGLAVVQVGQQRREARVAEVAAGVAGQQYDAVGVQGVQGVPGFGDRALDVGRVKVANNPKRPGSARTRPAVYSLTSRAHFLASVSLPRWTPGVDTDSTPVAMP
jgi:hypothetical protein